MPNPFVIAECGVNWRDLIDADQMIKAAANAGADAVKFQAFDTTGFPIGSALYNMVLSKSDIRFLYWRCQQHNIEFMCTPMYPEAIEMLNPYVKRWKIRYNDRENWQIINLCQATGKEILISTDHIHKHDPSIKLLYCIPEYPPSQPDPTKLKGFDGFSSHFPCISIPAEVAIGLQYLEVHVRLDKYEPPHYYPIDTNVSITMSELAELRRGFRL